MDLLDLKSTITTLDTTTIPQAAAVANSVVANAANLLNGTVNNAAVLMANLLSGIEGERQLAMTGGAEALKPVVEQWGRTNDVLERIAAILERVNLKP